MKKDLTLLAEHKLLTDTQIKKAITAELTLLQERFNPHFFRPESQASATAYLAGLISGIERKNSWQLAEQAGHESPYAFQYLLGLPGMQRR